ncbi:hypothetical protein [Pseudooceanicola sp.]|uniref:hypothetical protein n=1 Tax=Pseudooceanicola sp. TaxID=1914328 RepID=UPI0026188C09|nr:hypothetical protein [Pseudooceanicola sp.]MDF1854892.1 hypothetical protein [Pseudooceanicola sp.]
MYDLEANAQRVISEIAAADPGTRHLHLDRLHKIVGRYALTSAGIPRQLRQLQEELTNEAIEAQFDNLPV